MRNLHWVLPRLTDAHSTLLKLSDVNCQLKLYPSRAIMFAWVGNAVTVSQVLYEVEEEVEVVQSQLFESVSRRLATITMWECALSRPL